jgi:short-subunit dehydrogenase
MAGLTEKLVTAWRQRWWRPDAAALAAYAGLRPMTVITGATGGIGAALARQFARGGHDLLLIARNPEVLEETAAAIRAGTGSQVEAATLALDITAADAIARIEAALAQHGAYADVLVNSAGIGLAGPLIEQSPDELDQLVDLNIRVLTALTRHFLPGMRARGRGGILNLASLGGYAPGPYQAAYYASKAYVISLSEALAAETAGEGVRVCVLAPGPVATAFHERMRGESGLYLRLLPVASPDSVARAGYLAFALGWRVVVPGLVAPILALAMRLTPHRILVAIVGWLLKPRATGTDAARR